MLSRGFLAIVGLTLSLSAHGGMASGPFVVWVNLNESTRPEPTKALLDYLNSQRIDRFCGDAAVGWIVYAHTRPAGMSNRLVTDALVDGDSGSKKKLITLLKDFKDDDVRNGLDGVVVFTEKGGAHLVSLDVRGKVLKSDAISEVNDSSKIVADFCAIYPQSFRK